MNLQKAAIPVQLLFKTLSVGETAWGCEPAVSLMKGLMFNQLSHWSPVKTDLTKHIRDLGRRSGESIRLPPISPPPPPPGARFSKVSKLYGPFPGVTISSVSQEQRGFKSSNFTDLFLLVSLKTC